MAGWKKWVAGDVFTASDVNEYFMKQAIPRFASTAARDAALTGADAPAAGQFVYVTGVGLQMWDGATWGTYGAGTYTYNYTVPSLTSTINISIPSTVRNWVLTIQGRGDTAAYVCPVGVRVNGNTGSVYRYYDRYVSTVGASVATTPNQATATQTFIYLGYLPGTSVTAGVPGICEISCSGWSASSGSMLPFKVAANITDSAYSIVDWGGGTAAVAAPYTTLNVIANPTGSSNFTVGTTFSVRGWY